MFLHKSSCDNIYSLHAGSHLNLICALSVSYFQKVMRRLVAALILSLGHSGPLLTYRRYSQPTKLDSLNAPLVGANWQLVILQIWLLSPRSRKKTWRPTLALATPTTTTSHQGMDCWLTGQQQQQQPRWMAGRHTLASSILQGRKLLLSSVCNPVTGYFSSLQQYKTIVSPAEDR